MLLQMFSLSGTNLQFSTSTLIEQLDQKLYISSVTSDTFGDQLVQGLAKANSDYVLLRTANAPHYIHTFFITMMTDRIKTQELI